MFPRGLKTNVILTIAILLFLAMLLVDFVLIIMTQRELVRAEVDKGMVLLDATSAPLVNAMTDASNQFKETTFAEFESLVHRSGYRGVLIQVDRTNILWSACPDITLENELKMLGQTALQSGKGQSRYQGSAWGVFGKQDRNLIIAAPLKDEGNAIAAVSIAKPLESVYATLRRSQQILVLYILINTLILTLIGFFRLSKIFLRPINRLVQRAE
jgi:hypothetical protein